jgi:hypothetical protein
MVTMPPARFDRGEQAGESILDPGQHGRSLRRQFQCPGQAIEQRQVEELFQQLDLVADRRRGDRQLGRRLFEAQVACRRLEGAQGIERWQARLHG